MASSLQTSALQRALQAARTPSELATALIDPTDLDAALPVASGGYPMGDAVTALLAVGLRRHAPARTTVITVNTADLTATYTLTVGVTSYAYDAAVSTPADLDELLTQWADEINADSPGLGDVVTATADTTADTITVTQRASRAGLLVTLTQSGTAVADLELEYETGTVYPYVRAQTQVRSLIGAAKTAAEEAVTGWQPAASGGVPAVITLTTGQGWTQGADVGSIAAIGFFAETLAGVAGDQAVGTVGGITTAYRTPHAWAAPGVVST